MPGHDIGRSVVVLQFEPTLAIWVFFLLVLLVIFWLLLHR